VGIVEPTSLDDYLAHGGYHGLRHALTLQPEEIVQTVIDSGLRGRGGAAFPTGIKWQTVLNAPAIQKYITCNADEGDSGTFADRMLMEGDPFILIEGMTIAALAVGATQGYIYLRAEYPHAHRTLKEAIAVATAAGYLGANVLNSGKRFELEVRLGAGAYICGEETSMLESLEGRRGEVRVPAAGGQGIILPADDCEQCYFGQRADILDKGAAFYREFGTGNHAVRCSFSWRVIKRGGLGTRSASARELLYDYAGGSASGRPIRTVQIGGPLGVYVPESQFDTPLDYEALSGIGALLGHGGIVAFDDTVDMARMARYAMEFCANESCGKCTPCRIGSIRGVEVIDRILQGKIESRICSFWMSCATPCSTVRYAGWVA
jgi:formate dehydrogenase iron-sulfur subunit